MSLRPQMNVHTSRHLGDRAKREGSVGSLRGFTLLELMVVVVIITLLATIALPGLSRRIGVYRGKQAAEELASVFRNARLRALGRGACVMVLYDGATNFEVREAIAGTTQPAGCEAIPDSSCFPAARWNLPTTTSREVSNTDFGAAGEFSVTTNFNNVVIAAPFGVTFSPLGRTYETSTGALLEMNRPLRIDIARSDGVSVSRSVVVTPAGTARVVVGP